jgi:sugar phosphate isomerase/epimerase
MTIATSLNICPSYLTETTLIPRLTMAGFDGIDFNFCDLTDRIPWEDEHRSDAWLDTLAAAAAQAGLTWVQAHGPMFHMFGDSPQDQKRRGLCPAALRACGRLGVPWMVLHPETLPGAFHAGHHSETLARNVAFFRELLPLCERYGVGLAVENLPEPMGARGATRSFGGVPSEMIEIIDTLDHPLVGACWDTGHARVNQLDQRAGIEALGARLKVLHLQENDGRGDDHMLPYVNGRLGVDWQAVTDGLRAVQFSGALTYEVHNAFQAVPEPLFDPMLRLAATAACYLAGRVEAG